ncbi:Poly [ADP-ribose] polymerase tankyrase-2 [Paramyrothecium foliicola]|nr:Poly [ADP-ribose] polymerase tankyrase-2 [Paramyrothecium foliicola]
MSPSFESLPVEVHLQMFEHVSSSGLANIARQSPKLRLIAEHVLYTRDCNEARENSPRALLFAARTNRTAIAKKSFGHGGRDVINFHGHDHIRVRSTDVFYVMTPLFVAASNGSLEVLNVLIENGALINKPSIVHYAISRGPEYYLVTPLSIAIDQGNGAAAHSLLNHGADTLGPYKRAAMPYAVSDLFLTELPNATQGSALGQAVHRNLSSIVNRLLMTFQDINHVYHNRTALQIATSKAATVKYIPRLLDAGAAIVGFGPDRLSPLHYLAMLDDQNAAIRGIRYIAYAPRRFNPNPLDRQGRTPLSVAASKLSAKIIRELLAVGADPEFGPTLNLPMRMVTATVMSRSQKGIYFSDQAVRYCILNLREAGAKVDPICLMELGQVNRLDLITQLRNPEATELNV